MKHLKRTIAFLCILCSMIFVPESVQPYYIQAADTLKVSYINVGQGSSVLIQLGDTSTLIDTGKENQYKTVKSYLKKQNVKKINNLVITHPDSDHMGAADLIVDNFKIGKYYTTKYKSTTNESKELRISLNKKNIKTNYVTEGKTINIGSGATCTVLSPEKGKTYNDSNSASVVLLVKYGSKKFLFLGDATSSIENRITKDYNVNVDVLMVSHHGSDTASGAAFLKEASPEYSIISVGANNSYGHPDKNVMNRLKTYSDNILRTDKNGTILITSNGKNLKASYTGSAEKGNKNAKLNKTSLTLGQGDTYKLKVSGNNTSATWSTSDKSIATVDKNGKVTTKKAGKAVITAKCGSRKLTCTVNVKKRTISEKSISLKQGASKTLYVNPDGKVKWSSSNSSVAKIDSNGTVTGVTAGTATITAAVGNQKLKCSVTVKKKTPVTTTFIGNKNSKIYHTRDCGHLPAEKNRVYFNSESQAINAGYKKCAYCSK